MLSQPVNPNTGKNIQSFKEMTDKEVDGASEITKKEKQTQAYQITPSDEIEDTEVQEVEISFQRRPQFKLNECSRRRFY